MTTSRTDLEAFYAGFQAAFSSWPGSAADDLHFGGDETTELLGQVLELKPTDKVMEIGSGLGGSACYLAGKYGCDVTGIDITEVNYREAVKRTKDKGLADRVHFELGDARAMPFGEDIFDAVYSIDAIYHVVERDLVIGECARVLRPGGTFAFLDWVQVKEMEQEERDSLFASIRCENLATMEEYKTLLTKYGFEVLREDNLVEKLHEVIQQTLEQIRVAEYKEAAAKNMGEQGLQIVEQTFAFWSRLVAEHKIGWALFVSRKG